MTEEYGAKATGNLYLTDDLIWAAHDLALLEDNAEAATGLRMIINEIYGNPNIDKNAGDTVGPLLTASQTARDAIAFVIENERAVHRVATMMRLDLFVANVGLRACADPMADQHIERCRCFFAEMASRYDQVLGERWMIPGQGPVSLAMSLRVGFFRVFQVGIKGSDEGVTKIKADQ